MDSFPPNVLTSVALHCPRDGGEDTDDFRRQEIHLSVNNILYNMFWIHISPLLKCEFSM